MPLPRPRPLLLLAGLTLAPLLLLDCGRKQGTALCSQGSLEPYLPVAQVDQVSTSPGEVRILAIGSAGFLVLWTDGSASSSNLKARWIAPNGIALGSEVPITQLGGVNDFPRLAQNNGLVAVAFRSNRLGRYSAWAAVIPANLSTPSASLFEPPTISASQDPRPEVAAYGTAFLVAWNGRGPDGNDHLFRQRLSRAGAAAGAPLLVVPGLTDRASAPSAAILTSGGGLAVADAESEVGLANPPDLFGYSVTTTAAKLQVHLGQNASAVRPELAPSSGQAAMVWCDARTGVIQLFYAAFGNKGLVRGEQELTLGATAACEPSLTPAAGDLLLAWNEHLSASRAVHLMAVSADALPDSRTYTLSTGAAIAPPGTDAALAARPDVAWNGVTAGVTWTDGGHVWFQPLSCLGKPIP